MIYSTVKIFLKKFSPERGEDSTVYVTEKLVRTLNNWASIEYIQYDFNPSYISLFIARNPHSHFCINMEQIKDIIKENFSEDDIRDIICDDDVSYDDIQRGFDFDDERRDRVLVSKLYRIPDQLSNFSASLDDLRKEANYISSDLVEEVERIYRTKPEVLDWYPVMYIISGFSFPINSTIIGILMNALMQNNRLMSKHLYHCMGTDNIHDLESVENEVLSDGNLKINDMPNDTMVASRCASYNIDQLPNIACVRQIFITTHKTADYWRAILLKYHLNAIIIDDVSTTLSENEITEITKSYIEEKGLSEKDVKEEAEMFLYGNNNIKFKQRSEIYRRLEFWYDYIYRFRTTFGEYYDVINKNRHTTLNENNSLSVLNNLVGIKDFKDKIRSILNTFLFYAAFDDAYTNGSAGYSYDINFQNRNMIFTGNPGTCKTTAARLLANILFENGLIPSCNMVEVGRSQLVGKYVGWTAPTIVEKYDQAVGGILFIDEAYSLVTDDVGGYGSEAISTIVECMENYRHDVITIFAGYPKEMKAFVESNPGLRSRIGFYIDFPNYSLDELVQVFVKMVHDRGMKVTPGALRYLEKVIEPKMNAKDFGNGRFVRNVLDKVIINHANRLGKIDISKIPKKSLTTITKEDCMNVDTKEIVIHESKAGF